MFQSVNELIAAIHKSHRELRSKKGNIVRARAEAQQFAAVARLLDVELKHAASTGRLRKGNPVLPDVLLRDIVCPSLDDTKTCAKAKEDVAARTAGGAIPKGGAPKSSTAAVPVRRHIRGRPGRRKVAARAGIAAKAGR